MIFYESSFFYVFLDVNFVCVEDEHWCLSWFVMPMRLCVLCVVVGDQI